MPEQVGRAVDVHAHAMPLPVLRWLADRGLADLTGAERGVVLIDPAVSGVGRGAPIPLAPSMTDPGRRVAELDAAGLSHQAVSLPPFLMASTNPDAAFVTELAHRGTEALLDYCAAAPARLLPLASVPVGTPSGAAAAAGWLGAVRGFAVGSRGAGRDLDDPVNAELWSVLSQAESFVLLHPSAIPDPGRLGAHWFPQLVGYPIETAIATARLAAAGVLEATPLRLCLAHGGGCLPALRPRLDLGWHRKDVARATAAPYGQVFARLYYDTAVFDPVALRRLVEDVGAGQVLLGTDHPFDLAERDPVGFVRSAALAPDAEAAVLHATAARLLRLAG